jgi:hypothetical protein
MALIELKTVYGVGIPGKEYVLSQCNKSVY